MLSKMEVLHDIQGIPLGLRAYNYSGNSLYVDDNLDLTIQSQNGVNVPR